MSDKEHLPSRGEINELLQKLGSPLDASEVHGILCGMLSGGLSAPHPPWLNTCFDPQQEKAARLGEKLIKLIFNDTKQQLTTFGFELQLLLADDDASLNLRFESLSLWCQGFLLGIDLAIKGKKKINDEDAKEALGDLQTIAHAIHDNSDSEENEQALEELCEYVRLAAMLLFTELNQGKKQTVH